MRQPPAPIFQNVLVSRPVTSNDTNVMAPYNPTVIASTNAPSSPSTKTAVSSNSNNTTHPTNAVARRDDLLAAAVLAAEDTHDTRHNKRSVLARMTRGWARFSDSIWGRRRPPSKSTQQSNPKRDRQQLYQPLQHQQQLPPLPPPIPLETDSPRKIQIQPPSTTLARERQLRAQIEEEEELAVRSLRESSLRRVRQVGAKDDDDTLLVLPRITSSSFSNSPSSKDLDIPHDDILNQIPIRNQLPDVNISADNSNSWDPIDNNNIFTPARRVSELSPRPTTKVRPLPRVSALMPTRPPGAPPSYSPASVSSPVSSSGRPSSSTASSKSSRSSGRKSNQKKIDQFANKETNIGIGWGTRYGNGLTNTDGSGRKFQRLPTGLLQKDVDKEVEQAVIEISSDYESEPSSQTEEIPHIVEDDDQILANVHEENDEEDEDTKKLISSPVTEPKQQKLIDPNTKYGIVRIRSKSEISARPRRFTDDSEQLHLTNMSSHGASSNRQDRRSDDQERRGSNTSADRQSSARSNDITLFEDDYLSFQGFHGNARENRNPYQSMGSLLRSKRISSITDSPSEDSDEYLVWSTSCMNQARGKNNPGGSGGPKSWLRRNSLLDKMVGS